MGKEKSYHAVQGEGDVACPECKSTDITKKKGELFCNKCGFVIDD